MLDFLPRMLKIAQNVLQYRLNFHKKILHLEFFDIMLKIAVDDLPYLYLKKNSKVFAVCNGKIFNPELCFSWNRRLLLRKVRTFVQPTLYHKSRGKTCIEAYFTKNYKAAVTNNLCSCHFRPQKVSQSVGWHWKSLEKWALNKGFSRQQESSSARSAVYLLLQLQQKTAVSRF